MRTPWQWGTGGTGLPTVMTGSPFILVPRAHFQGESRGPGDHYTQVRKNEHKHEEAKPTLTRAEHRTMNHQGTILQRSTQGGIQTRADRIFKSVSWYFVETQ